MLNSEKIKKINFSNFLELLQFKVENINRLKKILDIKDSLFDSKSNANNPNQTYYNCLGIKYLFFVLLTSPFKYNADKSNVYYDKVLNSLILI